MGGGREEGGWGEEEGKGRWGDIKRGKKGEEGKGGRKRKSSHLSNGMIHVSIIHSQVLHIGQWSSVVEVVLEDHSAVRNILHCEASYGDHCVLVKGKVASRVFLFFSQEDGYSVLWEIFVHNVDHSRSDYHPTSLGDRDVPYSQDMCVCVYAYVWYKWHQSVSSKIILHPRGCSVEMEFNPS